MSASATSVAGGLVGAGDGVITSMIIDGNLIRSSASGAVTGGGNSVLVASSAR